MTSLKLPLWGGEFGFSMAYYPKQDHDIAGGRNARPGRCSRSPPELIDGLDVSVSGELDSVFELGADARGPWIQGRIGLHEGVFGEQSWLANVVRTILAEFGKEAELEAVQERLGGVPANEGVPFDRIALNVQTRDDGIAIAVTDGRLRGAHLVGEGLLAEQGTVAGAGTLDLAPDLSAELVRVTPALESLVAESGRLRVPVRLEGKRGAGVVVD